MKNIKKERGNENEVGVHTELSAAKAFRDASKARHRTTNTQDEHGKPEVDEQDLLPRHRG